MIAGERKETGIREMTQEGNELRQGALVNIRLRRIAAGFHAGINNLKIVKSLILGALGVPARRWGPFTFRAVPASRRPPPSPL